MSYRTIRRLEATRARLQHALRRNRSLLSAVRRKASKREADKNNRKRFVVGCAVEAAMKCLWTVDQRNEFWYVAEKMCPPGFFCKSRVRVANARRTGSETRRARLIRWGHVAYERVSYGDLPASDLETAARRFLFHPERRQALNALTESQAWALQMKQEYEQESQQEDLPSPAPPRQDCKTIL
jgi:hypothetical protein